MAYYYVKSGGTATGDAGRYASQQTGSFATLGAANYYNDIQDAIDNSTTSPVAGDFINVSDLHVDSVATSIIYTGTVANPYYIVSVDDSTIENSRTSGNFAEEENTANSDIAIKQSFISGVSLISADAIIFSGANILHDCKLTVPGNTDETVDLSTDGSSVNLVNTAIHCNDAGAKPFTIDQGGTIAMTGGSIQTTAGSVTNLTNGGFTAGGGALLIEGADLSVVTGTLIANVGSNVPADHAIDVKINLCKLAAGVAFTNEVFKSYNQRALFTRCSDSSTAAEHQYHLHAFGGDVDDDSTIRRADDPAFEDSGTTISYKIVTNSDASLGSPLWFDFPNTIWAALSAGATDTLRIHVASTATLTDKDIYVEVSYPDGTNKQTPNRVCSAPATVGGTLDLMATGTTLTTDSGSDWRDGGSALAGHNEYYIDVSTSGDVGADTVPIVKVYVTKPSTTIQLGSIYELN